MYEIKKDFTKYKLIDKNKGRVEFWDRVMRGLQNCEFSILIFTEITSKTIECFYENENYLEKIYITGNWKVNNFEVTYDTEIDYCCFLHEASHFLHLSVDDQVSIVPENNNKKIEHIKENIREIEYEAAYRSVFYSKQYKMFLGSRTVLDINLLNLLHYDIKFQPKEWQKKYSEKTKNMSKEEVFDYNKKLVNKINKIIDWYDKNHKIDLI